MKPQRLTPSLGDRAQEACARQKTDQGDRNVKGGTTLETSGKEELGLGAQSQEESLPEGWLTTCQAGVSGEGGPGPRKCPRPCFSLSQGWREILGARVVGTVQLVKRDLQVEEGKGQGENKRTREEAFQEDIGAELSVLQEKTGRFRLERVRRGAQDGAPEGGHGAN